MNRKQEKGIFFIAIMMWLAVMVAVFALCGCTTKKVVTEYVSVHDTIHSWHTDTVSVERWSYKHDTIKVEHEKIITLLQQDKTLPAETIRIESNHHHWEREVIRDSSSTFVAKVDSILKALDKSHQKEVVKVRMPIKQYLFFLLAVAGLIVLLWIFKK